MYVTAKTVLMSYGKLIHMAEDAEAMIENAAISSFFSREPAIVQAEKLCSMIEKKNALVNLRVLARKALLRISEDDFNVLAKRYGKSKKELYLSKRTYHRRVEQALYAYENALDSVGVTKELFNSFYAEKIPLLAVVKDIVLQEERARSARVRGLKLNKGFGSGSYRDSNDK